MAFYNGYSEAERNKAGSWQNKAVKRGWPSQPPKCIACGQTEGKIIRHLEDYTLPERFEDFAAEDRSIPVCYACHRQIHSRLKNPDSWNAYREEIRAGWRYAPSGSKLFSEQIKHDTRQSKTQHERPTQLILDEIHEGKLCPDGRMPGNSNGPTAIDTAKEAKWRAHKIFVERITDWTPDNIKVE